MASFIPYLALAIFPIASIVPFNLFRFSWGYHHGLQKMPDDVRERAEKVDRFTWPFHKLLTIAPVILLMKHEGVSPRATGLHLDVWQLNAALGICTGLMLVVIQGLLWRLMNRRMGSLDDAECARGPASLWLLEFLFGAFSEELWLAFCLVGLRRTCHSIPLSILLTAIAFGLAHFPYGFGAFATASYGALSGMLFLWRSSLLPSFLFHFVGNIGSLYWARRGVAQLPLQR
ncbi:MAG: CPBP family intramembrane metalloprotease [Acidobacteriia bacterium]|nr:CPBP family intramembrane metalloprotease [Terriglobia bacterium]